MFRFAGRLLMLGAGLLAAYAQAQDVLPAVVPVQEKNDIPLSPRQKAPLLLASTPEADRGIGPHEPVYFLLASNWRGEGHYGIKFQFSLRYRLLNPERPAEPRWWERFYLGYSQTSLWDLQAESKPFRDSSYRPEAFWDQPQVSGFPRLKALAGLRLGLGHESNGQSEAASRSINIAYVRPTFTLPLSRPGYVFSFAPKLYTYLDKEDNPDITRYRGYGDYVFKLRRNDDWEWAMTLRDGSRSTHGSLQLDASYPFRGFLRNLNGYLYFQYFNGYGETILDYNSKQPSHIGLGIIVVR